MNSCRLRRPDVAGGTTGVNFGPMQDLVGVRVANAIEDRGIGEGPLEGVVLLEMDFMHDSAPDKLIAELGSAPDLILSDMAANTVGHKQTDHLRTMGLVEAAVDFAVKVLMPGGDFVAKVFAGGTDPAMLSILKSNFTTVKHAKPPASRKGSVEWYVIAQGKKG